MKTRKGKRITSEFESELVSLQTGGFFLRCVVDCGTLRSQMFLMFLSLLTPFFLQVMFIGGIRIEKMSLACRKTQSHSFSVWQHTKDGTIKDLVLSSAPCRLPFSLQPLFISLKSLCKTENKAVLAHFSVSEKSNFLWNLARQTFISNSNSAVQCVALIVSKVRYTVMWHLYVVVFA